MSEFQRLRSKFGWRIEDYARFSENIWNANKNPKISYPDDSRSMLASIEDRSFWFRYRNRVILHLLSLHAQPAQVLWEIGAGNGFVAWSLQQTGLEVVAVEPSLEGSLFAARRGVRNSIAAQFEDLKLPDASIPAIGLFDVLEHLESPEPLLHEVYRTLEPGGVAIVTVPALTSLWSQADEDSGHYRRYTRRSLGRAMLDAKFDCIASKYFFASMVLPLFILRALPYKLGLVCSRKEGIKTMVSQLAPQSVVRSTTVNLLLGIERYIDYIVPLPWGTSVAGVYRKTNRQVS